MDLDIERQELRVTWRRTDQPVRAVHDNAITDANKPHGTRGRRMAVRGFKIESGEVDGHTSILAHATDVHACESQLRRLMNVGSAVLVIEAALFLRLKSILFLLRTLALFADLLV